MNMVPTQNFTTEHEVIGLEKTENSNPKLAAMVKAWEGKQGKVARRGGLFSMMAVGLSACGSSSEEGDDAGFDFGDIFNLTTATDNSADLEAVGVSDIAGNIFNALLDVGIDGLVGVQSLQSSDILVGTDEVDVLNATLNGTGAGGIFAAPSIDDIEVYNLTAVDGLIFPSGLDLFNASGYTELWNINSNTDLTLTNVREAATIGMSDVVGGTEYTVNFTSSADTAVQDVIARAVGTSASTGQADLEINAVNGIDTLNLDVSDIVRLHLENDAADMSIFNITGSGVTELSADQRFDELEVLDASGYTGDLTLDVVGSTILTSVVTNGGDDFINVNVAAFNDADMSGTGDLSVDLGAGADVLSLDKIFSTTMNDGDVTALDFTGGVTGVETLSFEDTVNLAGNATLNMDGISADLGTLEFTDGGIVGNGNELALANSPVDDLIINATEIDDLDLATGNVVNLDVNVTDVDATLDLDQVGGSVLETLDVAQINGDGGQIWLDIDSDATNDVSALQSITATAVGNADVELDADDANADMNALTTVSVVAGETAELEMDGVPVRQQDETIAFSGIGVGSADLLLPDGQVVTVLTTDTQAAITAKFLAAGGDYTAQVNSGPLFYNVNVTAVEFGPLDPIVLQNVSLGGFGSIGTSVTTLGVAASSYLGLETVVVEGAEAEADLDDVYGSFTLDVTATGVAATQDADVDVQNTNVTEITVTVSTDVAYNATVTDHVDAGTGHADIDIDGSNIDTYGNPSLTSLTVTSATANITLDDDLSSMTTVDLTGVVDQFVVDASGAEYEPDAGDYVTYLIGATKSSIVNDIDGDSLIDMAVARETVTFTEADFGTVVLNGFTAGDDPATSDRIDLSELGFTNNGQLSFEVGDYNTASGVWSSNASGDDVRITDLVGGPEMSGEIIITDAIDADAVGGAAPYGGATIGQDVSDDLSQYNMTYV